MKWNTFALICLLLHTLTLQGQELLPYIETKEAPNGLYGIPDGKGGWKVEPLFDFLLSFGSGEELTVAQYHKRYFVINRDFKVVTDGSYNKLPTITDNYILVKEDDQAYALNFRGERISDVYEQLELFNDGGMAHDEYLLCARRKGEDKYILLGLDFRSFCDFDIDKTYPSSSTVWVTNNYDGKHENQRALILFVKDGKQGLMNLKGEILIPATYKNIEEAGGNYLYEKEKLNTVCTKDEFERFKLFLAYDDDGTVTGFDMTGKEIFPKQPSNSQHKLFKKNLKKYIKPYLASMAEHDNDYKEKVYYPYKEFTLRMDGYAAELKTETKPSNYDLLALARKDKAEKERKERVAAIRQQTEARRAAQKRTTSTTAKNTGTTAGNTTRRGQRDTNGHIIDSEIEIPYMGGKMHMVFYTDGYSWVRTETPCFICSGSGQCKVCFGQGRFYNRALNTWNPCPACFGSLRCKYCQGRGQTVISRLWAPGEAEAYMSAVRSERASSSSADNASSSSRSSRSTRHDDGVEIIEYAPNYTGESNDVWCERCQEVKPRHSHIWKR